MEHMQIICNGLVSPAQIAQVIPSLLFMANG